jgi:hypothetical protein
MRVSLAIRRLSSQGVDPFIPARWTECRPDYAVYEFLRQDFRRSVDNRLTALLPARVRVPCHEPTDEYPEYGPDSSACREHIAAPDYMAYDDQAVQWSDACIAAV